MEPAASGAEYGEETPPVATTLFKFLTNFFLVRVTMDNKEAARKEDASRCFVVQGKRSPETCHILPLPAPFIHSVANLFGMKSNKQLAKGLCAQQLTIRQVETLLLGLYGQTAVSAAPASAAAKKPPKRAAATSRA